MPPYACSGDEVYAVMGAQTPLVLRPVTDREPYAQSIVENEASVKHLVGECYIHGIEAGPVIDQIDDGSRIELV